MRPDDTRLTTIAEEGLPVHILGGGSNWIDIIEKIVGMLWRPGALACAAE